ncbi:abortive infection system toxin AbiGii family protein [Lacrimispora xylanolytica]|uniref:Abortive infection system toxin AbiGii family protein n=1 Tax=Lacrimispora xylanolytica TaxID=29375 RepID=A0ABY7A968_9FIRM|nr:abortive infection system toxin AbiGii family protein [Lacrimispora xylanolytica]WAJ22086.1 abortive infection system toxin AbiGii family protein [Lacrimispora xylanolytica]
MFSNFKEAFIKKPQYTVRPPQAVLDAISDELPEGFSYIYVDDGFCRLNCENGFNLNSGKVILPSEAQVLFQSDLLSEPSNLLRYSYNAQISLQISPGDDGYYIVNGKKIKATEFIKAPMRNITTGEIRFFLEPPKFPGPFQLTVSGDGHLITLLVQRKPNNSIYIQKYESIDNSALKLSCLLDLEKEKASFTINISIGDEKYVENVVAANYIYNAFLKGKGFIGASNIVYSDENKHNLISEDTINFWDQLLSLEKFLNIKFDATSEITMNDANKITELYQSLIIKKPFKVFQTFNTVSGSGRIDQLIEDDLVGKQLFFEFTEEEETDLLGVHLKYWGVIAVYGATVKAIIFPSETGIYEVELCTTEGKKMYSSIMYFMEESQLINCRSEKNHKETFEKAEELQYIKQ